MLNDQPIYVIDTNVIIDYPDIIASRADGQPAEPTVDLSHTHIVIPTAVVRELSSFEDEKSDRGKAARIALKRISEIDAQESNCVNASYKLEHSTSIPDSNQTLSVLPVHKNFKRALPFCPSEEDMDGQIILATLTAIFLQKGYPIDGTCNIELGPWTTHSSSVTLLTNDNGLAIRARERGIKTERYGYKYPDPYTGRRDVIVPSALFSKFLWDRKLELKDWEKYMPDQPKLIANEFIVMDLANPIDYPSDFSPYENPSFSHIGRYDANEKAIVPLRYARQFAEEIMPLKNAGQAIYAEALMDEQFSGVICVGPAGSGKTFMATVYGYWACKHGKYTDVAVVPCDSRSKLGALPGNLDKKMDPDVQPIKNALRNYLLSEDPKYRRDLDMLRRYGTNDASNSKDDSSRRRSHRTNCEGASARGSIKTRVEDHANLIYNNWFSSIPIEHARGRDFAYELAIYDEFQDQTFSQADTLIKRLGTDGKIVITGDTEQIHAPYIDASSNGLVYASGQLMDSEMVAQVCFTEEEVIRHPLVKMVAMRQKEKKARRAN